MQTALLIARVIALTVILFICFAVAGTAVGLQSSSRESEQAHAAAALLVVCFLNAAILTHIIFRSRWSGWRLMAAVFVVFYGTMTLMGQIESAVFITRLPQGMLPRLFVMGALIAAPFSVLAVLVLGKRKAVTVDDQPNTRLVMPANEWAWKLAVIVIIYLILYFTFGYFVAWQSPAVREYYGGIDPGSFLAQMRSVLRDTPWLVPLQIVRALLWAAIALPVIRMMKGQWQETALALALLFGVLMNAQLLLPNPYMPEEVRMAHLMETASSNFIFGAVIGWLLTRRHTVSRVAVLQDAGG
jgi:hypothetical protein